MAESRQIVVHLDHEVVHTVPLATEVATIGRGPDNTIVLAHALVSRHHAELRVVPEGVILTDLDSSNGTFVDSVRLLSHQPRLLAPGATFAIRPFSLTYQAIVDGPTADEAPAPDAPETVETPVDVIAGALESEAVPAVAVAPEMLPVVALTPRDTHPVPSAPGPRSRYLSHLPAIFHDGDFLGRMLLIFESIWEPIEHRQDHVAQYFDPRTCPADFLPWLLSWLDMSVDQHWPEARVRLLASEAMHLFSWRGTRYGLTRMVEVCTGLTPEITESADEPLIFHVAVTIPNDSDVDRDLIDYLVLTHKPAHVGYVLDVVP